MLIQAILQPVKLRVSWCSEPFLQAGPKHCFNETLTDFTPLGFSSWKERLSVKFGRRSMALSYCLPAISSEEVAASPPFALDSSEDLRLLQAVYVRSLKLHTKPSTFRIAVCASASSDQLPSTSLHSTINVDGVQTRRQRSSAPPSLAPAPESCTDISLDISRQRLREAGTSGTTPVNKKLRPHQRQQLAQTTSCVTPKLTLKNSDTTIISQRAPDFCWENILRSIAKTIDKHHFASKLAANAPV